MKKNYFVSYDLNLPGQNYPGLIAALKALGAMPALKSMWYLQSTLSADQLLNHLKQFIDASDSMIVNDFQEWAVYNAQIKKAA